MDTPAAVEDIRKRFSSVRDIVGSDVDLAFDFHGRVWCAMAPRLTKVLEPDEPAFIEEPVLPENIDCLRTMSWDTTLPVATGERLFSRWDFKSLFRYDLVDIIQPNITHAGGISEVPKIAAMAAAHDIALAPNSPHGPISFIAAMHICACSHNVLLLEQTIDLVSPNENDRLPYVANSEMFRHEDGYLPLPDGPGLDIEIDESYLQEHTGDIEWHYPVWYHDDGSVAEW